MNVASLNELLQILQPSNPDSVSAPPWADSLQAVGIEFPLDFRMFVERYGFGAINDYLHILPMYASPADRYSGFSGYLQQSAELDFGSTGDDVYDGSVLRFYPDASGMILWARDDAGNSYFWSRDNENPDQWSVIVWMRGVGEWFRHDGGMISCILSVLREEFPWPGAVLNPEPEWEAARRNPVWEFYSDWAGRP